MIKGANREALIGIISKQNEVIDRTLCLQEGKIAEAKVLGTELDKIQTQHPRTYLSNAEWMKCWLKFLRVMRHVDYYGAISKRLVKENSEYLEIVKAGLPSEIN